MFHFVSHPQELPMVELDKNPLSFHPTHCSHKMLGDYSDLALGAPDNKVEDCHPYLCSRKMVDDHSDSALGAPDKRIEECLLTYYFHKQANET